MSPAQRFGFLAPFTATGIFLSSQLHLNILIDLGASLIAGLIGLWLVRVLIRPHSNKKEIRIGKEFIFEYTDYGSSKKWSAEVFFGSLYFYCFVGLFIWTVLSWIALGISLKNFFFFLNPGGAVSSLSPDFLKKTYATVFYVGIGSSSVVWLSLYISEVFQSYVLSKALPIAVGLVAGFIEHWVLGFSPWPRLLFFLLIGFIYPYSLIPRASGMCTRAGLR